MKKIFLVFVIILLVFMTTSLGNTVTTNTYNVPIQIHSNNQQVISLIPTNTLVETISSNGTWYYVKYNGIKGYIYKGYTLEGLKENTITRPTTNNEVSTSKLNSLKSIIEYCKAYCRDNNFSYGTCRNITTIRNGNKVDCSSYVSWVLYEYGKANNISSLVEQYDRQNTSGKFNSIGSSLKNGNYNKHFTLVNGIKNAQLGDILCYDGHVEIYAGSTSNGRAKVYNCGSTNYIRSKTLITTASRNTSQITYILRLKV